MLDTILTELSHVSLGSVALKTSLNIVSAVAFLGVAIRYGWWTWRDWRSLRHVSLGTLPLSVALLMLFGAISSGYYGASRIITHMTAVDMRDTMSASVTIGALSLFAVALHMVALWRAEGVSVWPRVIRCSSALAIAWAALAWALW